MKRNTNIPTHQRFPLLLALVTLGLTLLACTVEAQPIEFGKDQCHFCQMTIVDRQHASQVVTKKGKQLHYDSIECLVNELLKAKTEPELAIILVSDYGQSKMTSATGATYLISEKIKSPMGANLSAFQNREKAVAAQKESGGEIYTWDSLKERFSKDQP